MTLLLQQRLTIRGLWRASLELAEVSENISAYLGFFSEKHGQIINGLEGYSRRLVTKRRLKGS